MNLKFVSEEESTKKQVTRTGVLWHEET